MGNIEHAAARAARRPGRLPRALATAACAAGLLLGASGCGFEAQTLQPYTPAEGVNIDVATEPGIGPVVMVRGLMIISDTDGQGFLSAALVVERSDTLVDVSGVPIGPDGAQGPPLTVTVPDGLTLEPAEGAVVLVDDRTVVTVEGEGLVAGLTAELTLSFAEAGDVTLIVPIVELDDYSTVTPPPDPVASVPGRSG